VEAQAQPRCQQTVREIRSLMESLRRDLPEFRRAQALGYPIAGMISLIVMAMATGARQGPDDLAKYADTLSQPQLRALGFRQDRRTRRYRSPKKSTFTRVLAGVDGSVLERLLLGWQERLTGPVQDSLVIVDGKKMRHGGVEMVNATNGRGQYLGGVMTEANSNEIPAARQLLGRLDLVGKLVLSDAAHTQVETSQQILFERGADYLMTVKANQKTLQSTLANLFEKQAFSPSGLAGQPRAAPGAQSEPAGNPLPPMPGSDSQPSGLSGSQVSRPAGDPRPAPRPVDAGSRLSPQQSAPGAVAGAGPAAVQTPVLGH
jgi:hypothetical protein